MVDRGTCIFPLVVVPVLLCEILLYFTVETKEFGVLLPPGYA